MHKSWRFREFPLPGQSLSGQCSFRLSSQPSWKHPTALEQRLIVDAQDSRLDQFSLFEAAWIVSGMADEDELRQRSAEFEAIGQQLRAACAGQSVVAQVESIFHFTHQRFLNGQYDAECSDLQRTMDEGRFNCVTATVIFHCLCEQAGLDPQIVAVPGHVYSHFQIPGIGNVQTTCADWFESPRNGPLDDTFDNSGRRIITPIQLLGKIYYNAGIALLEDRSYERAVTTLELSTRLDADDQAAHDNLLAAINNWSLAEEDAGRNERASELIERGLRLEPAYAPLLANDLHIHQKRALALCDAGRYAEAWGLLERCRVRRPDVPLFDAGRLAVVASWSDVLISHGRFQEAFEALDVFRARCTDSQQAVVLEETLVCRLVDELLGAGRKADAAFVAAMAVQRQPNSPRLQEYRDLTLGQL